MTISQHAAVIAATKEFFGDRFQPGMDVKTIASKSDKQAVVNAVIKMFQEGTATISDEAKVKYTDLKDLKTYAAGLVTNWWNKSKELNGGTKFETKNPGARAGSQDEQVKEMKNLQKRLEVIGNIEGALKVAQAITDRLEELKAICSNKKLPEVDISKIPESLRSLVESETTEE